MLIGGASALAVLLGNRPERLSLGALKTMGS